MHMTLTALPSLSCADMVLPDRDKTSPFAYVIVSVVRLAAFAPNMEAPSIIPESATFMFMLIMPRYYTYFFLFCIKGVEIQLNET